MAEKFRYIFLKSAAFKQEAGRLDAWEAVDDLKWLLDVDPAMGSVIPGGQGLRKTRVALPGRGKSGGARVVYFQVVNDCVLLLAIYAKNEKEDLSRAELEKAIGLRDKMLELYEESKS